MLEKTLESSLDCKEIKQKESILKEINPEYSLEGLMLKLKLQYFGHLMQRAAAAAKSLQSCLTLCDPIDGSPLGSPIPGILQATTMEWVAISFSNAWKWKVKELSHCKRPWCWERLKAGGEGDNRGWDGWTASLTQWTWGWTSSGCWWQTEKHGMLQSKGSQSQTRLSNWTELSKITEYKTNTDQKRKTYCFILRMNGQKLNFNTVYLKLLLIKRKLNISITNYTEDLYPDHYWLAKKFK